MKVHFKQTNVTPLAKKRRYDKENIEEIQNQNNNLRLPNQASSTSPNQANLMSPNPASLTSPNPASFTSPNQATYAAPEVAISSSSSKLNKANSFEYCTFNNCVFNISSCKC